MLGVKFKINAVDRYCRPSASTFRLLLGCGQFVGMTDHGPDAILRKAKELSFDTPEKVKVKKEESTTSPPSSSKKQCSTMEKFLKKLPGDTSLMRDSCLHHF